MSKPEAFQSAIGSENAAVHLKRLEVAQAVVEAYLIASCERKLGYGMGSKRLLRNAIRFLRRELEQPH